MLKLNNTRIKTSVGSIAMLTALLSGWASAPCQAQSTYLPWAVGSTLLSPLRYLGYSAYGGSGFSNPIWYGGNILNQVTRGSGGLGYGGYSPYGNPNFQMINADERGYGQNPNPQAQQVIRYGYPSPQGWQRYPNNSGNSSVNGSGNNGFQPGGANANGQNSNNGQVAYGDPNNDPFLTPIPGGNSGAHNGFGSNSGKGFSQPPSSSKVKGGKNGWMAGTFVDTVNTKYNGDIESALNDPQGHAMAHSLGLVGSSVKTQNFSEERKALINRVLNDQSLDASSKMDAVKALLH